MGAFGDKFRKEREKKNISLDDVSNGTKISSRMLKAIEEEKFDLLPGGVFNKGFIRAYAKHLGMSEEDAISGYLAAIQGTQAGAYELRNAKEAKAVKKMYAKPEMRKQAADEADELPDLQLPRAEHVRAPANKYLDGRPRNRTSWGLIAAAVLVIALAVYLWTHRPSSAHPQVASTSEPASTPAPAPQRAVALANQNTANGEKPANAAPHTASQPVATSHQQNASSPTAAPATAPAAAPAPRPISLVVRAEENSWISVTVDGQIVSQETLIAPAHASFRASREIAVKVGNAGGVTFLWNGKEIPAQGVQSEAKTVVFDIGGLRTPQPVAVQPAVAPQSNE